MDSNHRVCDRPDFLISKGVDFVLSLNPTTLLITPVISIDWIGSFCEVGVDMLKSIKFGILVDFLSSSRQLDKAYQGWFVFDSVEGLFQRQS